MNILFVCSKNLSRSPTAEMIYKDRSDLKVKSAGTEPSAGLAQTVELTAKLINWSDRVPATMSAIADAVRWAQEIMKTIDERWPTVR